MKATLRGIGGPGSADVPPQRPDQNIRAGSELPQIENNPKVHASLLKQAVTPSISSCLINPHCSLHQIESLVKHPLQPQISVYIFYAEKLQCKCKNTICPPQEMMCNIVKIFYCIQIHRTSDYTTPTFRKKAEHPHRHGTRGCKQAPNEEKNPQVTLWSIFIMPQIKASSSERGPCTFFFLF